MHLSPANQRRFFSALALVVGLSLSGCIIGTWPTPENNKTSAPRATAGGTSGGKSVASEACDGLDNDADGSVDEGCKCTEQVRGCPGFDGVRCGFGVQRCQSGVWSECLDIRPSFSAPRTQAVNITGVSPATLIKGDTGLLTVSVEPVPLCSGIQVPWVEVVLWSSAPVMRVKAMARDDGLGADRIASDGLFETALANPFGPGVDAQSLSLSASAVLNGQTITAATTVALEEP